MSEHSIPNSCSRAQDSQRAEQFRVGARNASRDLDGDVLRIGSDPEKDKPLGLWMDADGIRWKHLGDQKYEQSARKSRSEIRPRRADPLIQARGRPRKDVSRDCREGFRSGRRSPRVRRTRAEQTRVL